MLIAKLGFNYNKIDEWIDEIILSHDLYMDKCQCAKNEWEMYSQCEYHNIYTYLKRELCEHVYHCFVIVSILYIYIVLGMTRSLMNYQSFLSLKLLCLSLVGSLIFLHIWWLFLFSKAHLITCLLQFFSILVYVHVQCFLLYDYNHTYLRPLVA